ncbi:MAG: TadE family protein [Anaerolineales bacterium]
MILLKRSLRSNNSSTNRGQSMVELALFFPVLLILLSGLIEFGFLLNEYLTLMDAARNAPVGRLRSRA